MTHPVSKHSEDLDGWEMRVLKPMVDAEVGVVGYPVFIKGVRLGVRNMFSGDSCPRSTDVTDKITFLGR